MTMRMLAVYKEFAENFRARLFADVKKLPLRIYFQESIVLERLAIF